MAPPQLALYPHYQSYISKTPFLSAYFRVSLVTRNYTKLKKQCFLKIIIPELILGCGLRDRYRFKIKLRLSLNKFTDIEFFGSNSRSYK